MASIRKEMTLRAEAAQVWDAVRDVGAIHTRLAPDFVTDVKLAGEARLVTFANGMTAKELIVDLDDAARRLAWSVVEGRPTHHNGSIQILPEGDGCRLIWIADILPHELKGPIGAMMQQGMDAMKRKLESA
jgi:Polyketide cyclase / dehydrase and lipid transport